MEKVVLADSNRLVLPQSVLAVHQWGEGMEFLLWDTGQELILKPVKKFPPSQLEPLWDTGQELILKPVKKFPPSQLEPPDTPSVYTGKPLSLEEMERAVSIEAGKHT